MALPPNFEHQSCIITNLIYKNMKKQTVAPEIKDQIINRIKNEGVSVGQAAKDHGIPETTIYTWIARKVEGFPTLAENLKLRKENDQLKILLGEITLKLSETQKKKS
jgi:transposase-like protein